MSTESLNKTSITENYISKKTPKKVNIDVLKRKIYEQQKKEDGWENSYIYFF